MANTQRTVLFVSDHQITNEGIVMHLQANGYRVLQACDAIDAEEKLQELYRSNIKVDAVVTDIHMGGNFRYPGPESGLALAEKLRSSKIVPYGNNIYLVAATADASFYGRHGSKLFDSVTNGHDGSYLLQLFAKRLGGIAPLPEKPQIILAGCFHPGLRRILQQMIESEGGEVRWAASREALVDHMAKSGEQLKLIISQFDNEKQRELIDFGNTVVTMQQLNEFSSRTREISIVSLNDGDLYTMDDFMRMSLQQPDGWKLLMNGIIAAIHDQSLEYDALNNIDADVVKFAARIREKLDKDITFREMLSQGVKDWADRTVGDAESKRGSPNV